MTPREVVISVVVLSLFGILAAATLGIPVAPPAEPDAPSAFKVDGARQRISVPEAAARRIGLDLLEVVPKDEPIIARLTAKTGFNMERLSHVKAQFPGKIVGIGPALGSQVWGSGQNTPPTLLCVVESVDLGNAKNTYQKARVQLTLDLEALERTKRMIEGKVVGPKFLLDAEAAIKKDKADVEAARQNLLVFGVKESGLDRVFEETRSDRMSYDIVAPISGTITEKNVTRGEFADNTTNLFTIADTSKMWVWGAVYEKDWNKVRVGQKMKIVLAAYPDHPLGSVVDFVSPEIDGATRSIMIRGEIDNSNGKVLSDMYGTILVTVDEGKGAIIVPSLAVVRDLKADKSYVFVRRESSPGLATTYERIPVETKSVDADHFRVLKSLSPGDWVVTRGALNLFDEMNQQ